MEIRIGQHAAHQIQKDKRSGNPPTDLGISSDIANGISNKKGQDTDAQIGDT